MIVTSSQGAHEMSELISGGIGTCEGAKNQTIQVDQNLSDSS